MVEDNMPYERVKELLDDAWKTINIANDVGYLSDELEEKVNAIAKLTYKDAQGVVKYWLTEHERDQLCIKRGTLTTGERNIMQFHVVMTKKILSEVSFGGEYSNVAKWAGEHHELLDGSGYPQGISGDEVCKETRILTVIDIFDGLYAVDRPYKKPIPIDKVFEIMCDMVRDGKIDGELFDLFKASKAWNLQT